MPENRFFDRTRATIVQKPRVAVDCLNQPDAPQWRRAPFAARRITVASIVGEALTHVVQQEIGERMKLDVAKLLDRTRFVRRQRRDMALRAVDRLKSLGAALDGKMRVNQSGGALPADPIMATGLIRLAQGAMQLSRPDHYGCGAASRAIVHGAGGVGMQSNCVFTLEV